MRNQEHWDKAWEAYCMKCETSFLVRQGFVACGLTNDVDIEDIYRKPEFVSEHEGRAAFLYCLISVWQYFEDLVEPHGGYYTTLSKNDKEDITLKMRHSSIDPMLVFYLLIHDVGEIYDGDKLDDGSAPHEEVLEDECAVMDQFFHLLPIPLFHSASGLHRMFEEYDDSRGGLAAFIKAVDKVEAIAFQLFLQKHDHFGNIMYKKPPSERDQYYAEFLDTNLSADIYTLHYRYNFKHINPEIIRPVNNFLEAAFRDVYGQIPDCMKVDPSRLKM